MSGRRHRRLALTVACAASLATTATTSGVRSRAAEAPTTAPSSSPSPAPDDTPLYVSGQLLVIARGYLAFTTGTTLRIRPGTPEPAGAAIGRRVLVTLDRTTREAVAIAFDVVPPPSAVDAAKLDGAYVVGARAGAVATSAPAIESVAITIVVGVPPNTPPDDDVYLATDRSGYNPTELRMSRLGGRRFSISLSLPAGTALRYEYTRGSNATIERDRLGDLAKPRTIVVAPGLHVDDSVARWADLS